MTEVLFYHLQNMSLENVLPPLLEKSLERGWRVVVQSTSPERTDALDAHYYDQAHFNRDFRRFFKMSPRQYRQHRHPIIGAAARARIQALGDPLQALQKPTAASAG